MNRTNERRLSNEQLQVFLYPKVNFALNESIEACGNIDLQATYIFFHVYTLHCNYSSLHILYKVSELNMTFFMFAPLHQIILLHVLCMTLKNTLPQILKDLDLPTLLYRNIQ